MVTSLTSMLITTCLSIMIIGVLILVHEAGHFIMARFSGVKVLRFSMGFGPRLFSWTRGQTEYALSIIPLGGYVKMAGEQYGERSNEPDEYLSKSVGARARIIFAGPFVNYLFAVVMLWFVFVAIGHPQLEAIVGGFSRPNPKDMTRAVRLHFGATDKEAGDLVKRFADEWDSIDDPELLIESITAVGLEASRPAAQNFITDIVMTPAREAGIKVGDRILAIGDTSVSNWKEMTSIIHDAPGKELELNVKRSDGTMQTFTVVPESRLMPDLFGRTRTMGLIGIVTSGDYQIERVGPIAAVGRTFSQINEWITQTALGIWYLVSGKLPMKDSVAGPIAIVSLTSDVVSKLVEDIVESVRESGLLGLVSDSVRQDLAHLFMFVSLISLALAIFNVFPIPILDGGHLLFLTIEKLRGRPVSVVVQERASQISLILILVLLLFVCVNDVNRFVLKK